MKIKIGHYVTTIWGGIYNVDRIDSISMLLTNIVTKLQVTHPKNIIRPLWIQAGDEVSISYANGTILRFTVDVILYDENIQDYEYVLYNNEIPNELLNSREIISYIDKFEP